MLIVSRGRPQTAKTNENAESVDELIRSQEDAPGEHSSQKDIAASVASIYRIIQDSMLYPSKTNKGSKLIQFECWENGCER